MAADDWNPPGKVKESTTEIGDDLLPDLDDDGDGLLPDIEPETQPAKPAKRKPKPKPKPESESDDDDDDDDDSDEERAEKKRIVRRAAKLVLDITAADAAAGRCTAVALNLRADSDAAAITTAILTSRELNLARQVLRDIGNTSVDDIADAIMLAGKLAENREQAARWWRVAVELDMVTGNMPRVTSAATVELVSALSKMTDEQRGLAEAASAMLAWRR